MPLKGFYKMHISHLPTGTTAGLAHKYPVISLSLQLHNNSCMLQLACLKREHCPLLKRQLDSFIAPQVSSLAPSTRSSLLILSAHRTFGVFASKQSKLSSCRALVLIWSCFTQRCSRGGKEREEERRERAADD